MHLSLRPQLSKAYPLNCDVMGTSHQGGDDLAPPEPSPELVAKNREVQRLLGRCLLRAQQGERILKGVLTLHRAFGTNLDVTSHIQRRAADVAKLGLGDVVDMLLEDFVAVPTGELGPDGDEVSRPAKKKSRRTELKAATLVKRQTDALKKAEAAGLLWMSTTMSLNMQTSEVALLEKHLRDFVKLRNRLVHNFSDDLDIRTEAGCERAISKLTEADDQFADHLEFLGAWARQVDASRAVVLRALADPEVQDQFLGNLTPDASSG